MKKVKITILKTTLYQELADEYGGKELFYYGHWIDQPNIAICGCNDGLRPVIMKLEATHEDAVISSRNNP